MNCFRCGQSNRAGVLFCEYCGVKLLGGEAEPTRPKCPICQVENRPGVRFCEHCGEELQRAPTPHKEARPVKPKARSSRRLLTGLAGVAVVAGLGMLLLTGIGGAPSSVPGSSQGSSGNGSVQSAGGDPVVVVSPSAGSLDTEFTVEGSGFSPYTPFVLYVVPYNPEGLSNVVEMGFGFDGGIYNYETDANGRFSLTMRIPDAQEWIDRHTYYDLGYVISPYYVVEVEFGYTTPYEFLHSNRFSIDGGDSGSSAPRAEQQDSGSSASPENCRVADAAFTVYPETITIGESIEVSGALSLVEPGETFYLEVRRGGNQGELVYSRPITLDQDCYFEVGLVSEAGDPPGQYRVLVTDEEGLIHASADFWLTTAQGQGQPAEQDGQQQGAQVGALDCTDDEYFRAGVNFKDALESWFGQIDDYWAANFERYFEYRFQGGEYDRPSLVFTPDPTQCDDGLGYSAQYLSNFNVVSGDMTVNEIRFDGPAFMDEYLVWQQAVPLVVLSHEFGHVLQVQSGLVNPGSPEGLGAQAELQADCFAGAYLQHLDNQGQITGAALQQVLEFHSLSGDLEGTNIPHGTSSERLNAIYTGLEGGAEACLFFYTP